MYGNIVYATNSKDPYMQKDSGFRFNTKLHDCLSVTNVDLIAALTLKMVELTILDISLEHVDLWLNIHFLASICYYE